MNLDFQRHALTIHVGDLRRDRRRHAQQGCAEMVDRHMGAHGLLAVIEVLLHQKAGRLLDVAHHIRGAVDAKLIAHERNRSVGIDLELLGAFQANSQAVFHRDFSP